LAYGNQQYDPGNTYAFVNTIATNNSLFFNDGVAPLPLPTGFENFYQINSDPLIARISTPNTLGVVTSTNDVINLSVYETRPIESKLDIYWETSTAGLIEELNTAIEEGSSESINSLDGWNFTLSESAGPGTITSTGFSFENILGDEIPVTASISSVTTGTGVNVTDKFVVEKISGTESYRVKTAPGKYFYYGFNAAQAESYTFVINATTGYPVISKDFVRTGALSNVSPSITNKPTATINKAEGEIDVYNFDGVNGSNPAGGNSTADISWSVTGSSLFSITSSGLLQQPNGTAEGTFNLIVTMTEASGATDSTSITVIYPFRSEFLVKGQSFVCTGASGQQTRTGLITVIGDGWKIRATSTSTGTGGGTMGDTVVTLTGESGLVIDMSTNSTPGNPGVTSWNDVPAGDYSYVLVVTGENGGACGGFESANFS
jgi:hypothetical protein